MVGEGMIEVNSSDISPGMYLIELSSGSNSIIERLIIDVNK